MDLSPAANTLPGRTRQSTLTDPVRSEEIRTTILRTSGLSAQNLRRPRCARRVQGVIRNAAIPLVFLLLVGILRCALARLEQAHESQRAGDQLLGGWAQRPDLLDYELPERRGQAAHYD